MSSLSVFSRRILLAAVLALALGPSLGGCAEARSAQANLRVEPLEVVRQGAGPVRFHVEIAETAATREHGLMFRRSLAPDAGMLFDFKTPREVAFWMKNTLIPLDIIFIAPDGRILNIAPNAVPLSEMALPSAGAVRGVLELRGGRAGELGILPGDVVRHRIFASR